jgi:hypothetical protein
MKQYKCLLAIIRPDLRWLEGGSLSAIYHQAWAQGDPKPEVSPSPKGRWKDCVNEDLSEKKSSGLGTGIGLPERD